MGIFHVYVADTFRMVRTIYQACSYLFVSFALNVTHGGSWVSLVVNDPS
jgi:hypothetical protein